MCNSDEARMQFGGQGSATSFQSIPAFNLSTGILYGPGSSLASRNASISGPGSYSDWARESMVTLDPRASRASSIISTHTKTSISTDHEDGNDNNDEIRGERLRYGQGDHAVSTNHTDHGQTSCGDITPRPQRCPDDHLSLSPQPVAARDLVGPELPSNPAEPTGSNMDMPLSDVGVSRNPSFTPGKETISVKKHRESGSTSSVTSATRTASPVSPGRRPLRRSGGIKLRVVTTTSQTENGISPASPGSTLWPRSAGSRVPSSGVEADQEPHSPAYFGRGATGTFPSPRDFGDIVNGFTKVIGKALRTPELSPHSKRVRDPSNSRNGSPFLNSISPGTTRHPRHEPTPHDSSTDLSKNGASQPTLAPGSSVQVDEAAIVAQSPPAMETENDLSIHNSRLFRTLNLAHQKEMRGREEVIRGLTQTILNLKTELVRAQHQVRPDKGTTPVLREEDTPEANAFTFPPLKLRHVKTLKRAIERRVEQLNLKSNSNGHAEKQFATSAPDSGNSTLDSASRANPNLDLQTENEGLRGMLCALQATIWNLELEVQELQQNLEAWANGSRNIELQQKQGDTEDEHQKIIERTRDEVNKKWEARWETNHEQLLDRMRRIENESQRLIRDAVEERDEEWAVTWAKKNAYLLTRLKAKEAEIKELKSAEARRDEGYEEQIKALGKRLAAEEYHTSVLQEMLLGLETQHAKTKSELQDLRCKGRTPNQVSSLSP